MHTSARRKAAADSAAGRGIDYKRIVVGTVAKPVLRFATGWEDFEKQETKTPKPLTNENSSLWEFTLILALFFFIMILGLKLGNWSMIPMTLTFPELSQAKSTYLLTRLSRSFGNSFK